MSSDEILTRYRVDAGAAMREPMPYMGTREGRSCVVRVRQRAECLSAMMWGVHVNKSNAKKSTVFPGYMLRLPGEGKTPATVSEPLALALQTCGFHRDKVS